ncbi:MAG: sigma 54-interacting transcriptional regulator [Moraxellaceae bacterium]|nr:sigma 54-interacting transcriptional regulator [Moraxellaceae bacterium]
MSLSLSERDHSVERSTSTDRAASCAKRDEADGFPLLSFPDAATNVLSIRAKALVFADPASRQLLKNIDVIAASTASVLVQGETGTGKELVARYLHEKSGRRGPFLAVNCGGFSENLIEAELFGHEAGAYTGAQGSRQGWFEAANGGTLFLDEIGDLPLAMQVKLLRVLQEREVVRLGSRKSTPVDVRLVVATNVDLSRAVASGHFRMDLYYRVNVASINLPPLRDRQGDIEPLARHFARVYAQKLDVNEPHIGARTLDALRAYQWPGNIRELENVIHYALLVCDGNTLLPEHLRFAGVATPTPAGQSAALSPEEALGHAIDRLLATPGDKLHDLIEHTTLKIAMDRHHHNQVRTAQALGISRNVLRTLLKRYQFID